MPGIVPASEAQTVTAHIMQQELTEPSVDADHQQQNCRQPQDKQRMACWRIVWRTSELAQVVTWEQEKGITKQTKPRKEQQKNGLEVNVLLKEKNGLMQSRRFLWESRGRSLWLGGSDIKELVEGVWVAIRVHKGSCGVTADDPEQCIVGNGWWQATLEVSGNGTLWKGDCSRLTLVGTQTQGLTGAL
ncbi:hypothetical protein BJ742DRAFT_742306 [Cladochytrium replicatum]|nr:hypothetical protein BJ742DRAFT_742306 [Cladochytrium replicatum]